MSIKNTDRPDMRGIEAFVAVMASGSMTAAAKRLGIGQPAITRLVRDLEGVLGFTVFERNGPRISPTQKGVLFHEDAKRLLTSYAHVAQRAATLRGARAKSITLAATPTMAAGMLPKMMQQLAADLPELVTVTTMDAEHLAQALQSGEAEYGLSALPLSHAGLDCLEMARGELFAVVPDSYPEDRVSLSTFRSTRLLTLGNSYRIRHKIDAALTQAGIEPLAELVTNNSLNAMAAAAADLGVALVDPVSAMGIGLQGVKALPVDVRIPYEWGLFRRTQAETPELDAPLMAQFRRVAQQLGGVVDGS
ncbi:DNA-binding transcriptional regulator, LysR family [Monaibacterium marinum]|uniref:DNA-binding transcriptional regulator, LysR family n=1 Tax=Pontivivens marinum TaxID=1690039 RepID=A0A2C9CRQ6_9RHOB|nr:LysR family transcriptional regulator [Monaibacterium marinum]SOH93937.1 DNA-binding transcriptional regulator, LysR family [Monaibacterium marinum]